MRAPEAQFTAPASQTTAIEIFKQIEAWSHWAEIGLVAKKEYGISVEQFATLLTEYQRFLTLIVQGNKSLNMCNEMIRHITPPQTTPPEKSPLHPLPSEPA